MIKPQIFFIAGCNGSGKSTFIDARFSQSCPRIDPDLIKKKNNCSEIEAGRIAINLTNYYLNNKISFIRESTLTSKIDFKILETSKKLGYNTKLFYIGVSDSRLLLERVLIRVSLGGHNIPKETILRRYNKSINNLIQAIPLFDEVFVIDNTGKEFKNVILFKNSEIQSFNYCPVWFEQVAQQLNIPAIQDIRQSPYDDEDFSPHP